MMASFLTKKNIFNFLTLILFFVLIDKTSYAGVIIQGSRIIYNENSKSVDVRVNNPDDIPYVIQNWFDNGNDNSKPDDKVDVPFITTPSVSRIEPNSAQVVRVIGTGTSSLPKDRESVYWFNLLQIPPNNLPSRNGSNAILLVVKSRIKLFFRPSGIGSPSSELVNTLSVNIVRNKNSGYSLEIKNPSPWFVSMASVVLNVKNKKINLEPVMVKPYGSETLEIDRAKISSIKQAKVIIQIINDQGAYIDGSFNVGI